jgi:putative acetyltransferase
VITIKQADPRRHLPWLRKSCDFIRALYPAEFAHTFRLDELLNGRFFVVRKDRFIIGCGAMVPFNPFTVELKHIFIDAAARGLGGGKALLRHIEQVAHKDGVVSLLLETGDQQPEATGLYRSFGYRNCLPYVAKPLPHALFMEKLLFLQHVK